MSRRPLKYRLKYAAKWAAAYALYYLGILHAWKMVTLRQRAIVLAYHRVLPSDAASRSWSHPAIVVRPETFDRHMRVLARHFRVLSLPEFTSRLRSKSPFEPGSCLVTFDDGWKDTYTEAWPLLRRYRMPAAVFLPVALLGSDHPFWQERLAGLLFDAWRRAGEDDAFRSEAAGVLSSLGLAAVLDASRDNVRNAIHALVQEQKRNDAAGADHVIEALCNLVGPAQADNGLDRLMTWEQAREMSRDGVVFGGHGATHRILTTIPTADVEHEARAARHALRWQLGPGEATFSYPNGDLDAGVSAAVRRAGFAVAFSMRRGAVSVEDDPHSIRRVNIHEDVSGNAPMFLARVLGIF